MSSSTERIPPTSEQISEPSIQGPESTTENEPTTIVNTSTSVPLTDQTNLLALSLCAVVAALDSVIVAGCKQSEVLSNSTETEPGSSSDIVATLLRFFLSRTSLVELTLHGVAPAGHGIEGRLDRVIKSETRKAVLEADFPESISRNFRLRVGQSTFEMAPGSDRFVEKEGPRQHPTPELAKQMLSLRRAWPKF